MALAFGQAVLPAARDDDATFRRRPAPRLRIVGGASAVDLDRRLLALSGRASRCRFVQGRLATQLLARRGWRKLGFVRLSDFSRERLGVGARAIEEAARVATGLEPLPRMTAAFLDGTLSWTAVRLVAAVACARDEAQWIQRAIDVDTRALEKLVRGIARENSSPSSDTDDTDNAGDADDTDDAGHDRDVGHDRDDPSVRWSVRVSRFGRRLWRAARELAERSAGSTLTPARVLEFVAAEAASGISASGPLEHQLDSSNAALLQRLRGFAAGDADAGAAAAGCAAYAPTECEAGATTGCGEGAGAATQCSATPSASTGPTAFDWREGLQTRDPELAAFLAELAQEETGSIGGGSPLAHGSASSASAERGAAADASAKRGAAPDASAEPGAAPCPSTGDAAFDWCTRLEERDPELAAFLAELAREEADASSDTDGPSQVHDPADADGTNHDESDGSADEATPFAHRPLDELLADIGASEGFAWLAAPATTADTAPAAQLEAWFRQLEAADPFAVDARLREVRLVEQRIDSELASLLREAVDGRLYRELGFKSLESYVESRLGLCPRTAWSLLAIERTATRRSPALARAWADGRVTSLAARALLPVLGHHHDEAWIARARTLTLRRLEAEVAWTLDRIDDGQSAEPPPADLDLAGAPLAGLTVEELQMRAHPTPGATIGIRSRFRRRTENACAPDAGCRRGRPRGRRERHHLRRRSGTGFGPGVHSLRAGHVLRTSVGSRPRRRDHDGPARRLRAARQRLRTHARARNARMDGGTGPPRPDLRSGRMALRGSRLQFAPQPS